MFFLGRAIKNYVWTALLLSLLVFFLSPSLLLAKQQKEVVKIGILAKRGAKKAMEKWEPTARYLTQVIQTHQFVIVPRNFNQVHTSVENAEIDFLVTNSGYYVLLEEHHGLSRIATLRNRWQHTGYQTFGGVVFTLTNNNEIHDFKDLKNKIFMAVDPNSFGGWLMARFELLKNGIDFDTYFEEMKFGGTHDNVVYAVRDKIVDAGTVRTDTLERMAAESRINLNNFKILSPKPQNSSFPFLRSTELYPEWPFAKLSHTSNDLSEQVSIALLNMPAQSPAAMAAKITGWTVPLDYRPVHLLMKELKIGRYKNFGKITLMDIVRQYIGWIIASVFVLAVMAGIFLYVTILNQKLKTARFALEKANDELESKVEKRTKELAQSERKYKIVADNTHDWECWRNPEGEFVYCSPSCKEISGHYNTEFINNPELLLSMVHPDDAAMVKAHREEEKTTQTIEKIEFRIIDSSGNEHWIEHICRAIFDQGKYLGRRASNRDITSKKRSDNKLKEQLAFETMLSEFSAEFVNLSLDRIDTAIEKWLLKLVEFINVDRGALIQIEKSKNRLVATHSVGVKGISRLKNIQIDDILPWFSERIKAGETLMFCRLPEDLPKEAVADSHFIVKEGLLSNCMTPLKAEGQLIGSIAFGSFSRHVDWSEELGARLRIVGEVFANAIIRQKNTQKNRKLQKQLQQTQKMEAIGTLAGGIAHDFNNILFSISGFTELSQIGLKNNEDIEEFLEKIMDAAIRAKDLVGHLLIFSRRAVIAREPMVLLPILKESLKFIRATLPTTIEIREKIKPVKSKIKADPTQIHQVLMNLFTNAGHSMKEKGGILSVSFEEYTLETDDLFIGKGMKKGVYNKITVGDTGYGIPKETIDKIFDPFFTTKKSGEGTGMGLSTVHGIIKDMGGSISVYSEKGKGTTFHVFLPVHLDTDVKETHEKEFTPRKGSETILVVDDEEGIRIVVRGLLEKLGYTVIALNSSRDALERFKKGPEKFNLVLTDLTMPDLTGLDLAVRLKEIQPDIPIILCTGFSDQVKKEDLVKAGISLMIMKPVIRKDLFQAIETALDT